MGNLALILPVPIRQTYKRCRVTVLKKRKCKNKIKKGYLVCKLHYKLIWTDINQINKIFPKDLLHIIIRYCKNS